MDLGSVLIGNGIFRGVHLGSPWTGGQCFVQASACVQTIVKYGPGGASEHTSFRKT